MPLLYYKVFARSLSIYDETPVQSRLSRPKKRLSRFDFVIICIILTNFLVHSREMYGKSRNRHPDFVIIIIILSNFSGTFKRNVRQITKCLVLLISIVTPMTFFEFESFGHSNVSQENLKL